MATGEIPTVHNAARVVLLDENGRVLASVTKSEFRIRKVLREGTQFLIPNS
jgi:hypothetical protein